MSSSAVLRRPAAERASVWSLAVAFVALLVVPGAAAAARCGDDVDGNEVACSCGDEVVSDKTLSPADPVTAMPCSGDGLVVSVPRDSAGITLRLAGMSITGAGSGVGIRVVRGGRDGSSIVGAGENGEHAEISGFRTGIRATGANILAEVSGVYVHDNTGDGLQLRGGNVLVENVVSENNGRDGVAVLGRGAEVVGVVAQGNASDGVQVRGQGSRVSAEATGNLRNGLVVSGRGNRVADSATSENGGVGIVTSGSGVEVHGLDVQGNAGGDVKDRAGAISGAAR